MNGIDSGTGGISRNRYSVRNAISTRPKGTTICRLACRLRSGAWIRMRRWMIATGTLPTSIESRNTNMPIEPITTGTKMAENDNRQTPSNANLNGSPSRLKRFDSLTTRTSTRNSRNANETSSEELLKKNSVYTLSSAPSRKCTAATRYSKYQRLTAGIPSSRRAGLPSSKKMCSRIAPAATR